MKKIFTTVLLAICILSIYAKHSKDFIIGDYSNINNNNYHNIASELRFNAVRLKTNDNSLFVPFIQNFSPERIDELDQKSLDVVIWDNGYIDGHQNSTEATPLIQSMSNHVHLDADYGLVNTDTQHNNSALFNFNYDPILVANQIIQRDYWLGEYAARCLPDNSSDEYYNVFTDLIIGANTGNILSGNNKPVLAFNKNVWIPDRNFYIIFRLSTNSHFDSSMICEVGFKIA